MLKFSALLLPAFAFLMLFGCGVNPVTHKREIRLVSESQGMTIGQKNYAPARQQQGGDYVIDPELTAHVQSVGSKQWQGFG